MSMFGQANTVTVGSQQQTISNIKSPFLLLFRINPYIIQCIKHKHNTSLWKEVSVSE